MQQSNTAELATGGLVSGLNESGLSIEAVADSCEREAGEKVNTDEERRGVRTDGAASILQQRPRYIVDDKQGGTVSTPPDCETVSTPSDDKTDQIKPDLRTAASVTKPDKNDETPSEPIPSTSHYVGSVGREMSPPSDRLRPTSESLKKPRKSLPLIPRLNQYERHPILQIRSTTGLSEFELLLMEESARSPRRSSTANEYRSSAGGGSSVGDRGSYCSERKLVPRGAHSEIHPLFKRSDSGLYELEEYLLEKNSMVMKNRHRDLPGGMARQSASIDAVVSTVNPRQHGHVLERRSTLGKLEPRVGQYERNELLESRDASGLSEMEKLLQEKHREVLQRDMTCTGGTCTNDVCPKCKTTTTNTSHSGGSTSRNSTSREDSTTAVLLASVDVGTSVDTSSKQAGTLLKRVRFQHQKSDVDESDLPPCIAGDNSATAGRGGTTGGEGDCSKQTPGNALCLTEDENAALEKDRKLSLFKTQRPSSQQKSCSLS